MATNTPLIRLTDAKYCNLKTMGQNLIQLQKTQDKRYNTINISNCFFGTGISIKWHGSVCFPDQVWLLPQLKPSAGSRHIRHKYQIAQNGTENRQEQTCCTYRRSSVSNCIVNGEKKGKKEVLPKATFIFITLLRSERQLETIPFNIH